MQADDTERVRADDTERVRADDAERVRYADANGLQIAYETFGRPGDPPVLLITGLATQMLVWPDDLCAALAARDLYVIRADNRDMGLSTHLDAIGPLSLVQVLRRRPPYTITDMAADLLALIEVLGVGPAHVVGASMGGFIAQTMALARPDLVRTLTLIMTSTGSRKVGQPDREIAVRMALRKPRADRGGAIESAIATFRQIGSPGYPFEEDLIRDIAGRSHDRNHNGAGRRRQLAAVVAQPDRTAALAALTMPTLVIHGLADRVVRVNGGRALAAAIPGARFLGYGGMGHNLPAPLWPEVVGELATHFTEP
jgi:pimeloyl-ACP methyl ester carboxylesterase